MGQGGLSRKAQKVQEDSRCKGIQRSTSKEEIKCVCLNARSIINMKDELNIMVDDIKPHIIGITESWANNDITYAELGLEGYAMFRKDRMGRRGGGVLLYIKDTIPAYEVQLQEEADCNEANVVIQEPLGSSDHNKLHFNINIKSDKTKVKQCRRDFRKGNYKEIRKSLALIDWNDKMKNKTATECWNILRGELDSAIDCYVPMKKQGKRSKKKHLSKEAFRKIRCKQNMWRVYKHTGKDKDYDAYKVALNAATNEVRKSKRHFEHKVAQNIKSDSKSFYAYVRSKHNVRDIVGPLEDNAGNIITQGVLMAE